MSESWLTPKERLQSSHVGLHVNGTVAFWLCHACAERISKDSRLKSREVQKVVDAERLACVTNVETYLSQNLAFGMHASRFTGHVFAYLAATC